MTAGIVPAVEHAAMVSKRVLVTRARSVMSCHFGGARGSRVCSAGHAVVLAKQSRSLSV